MKAETKKQIQKILLSLGSIFIYAKIRADQVTFIPEIFNILGAISSKEQTAAEKLNKEIQAKIKFLFKPTAKLKTEQLSCIMRDCFSPAKIQTYLVDAQGDILLRNHLRDSVCAIVGGDENAAIFDADFDGISEELLKYIDETINADDSLKDISSRIERACLSTELGDIFKTITGNILPDSCAIIEQKYAKFDEGEEYWEQDIELIPTADMISARPKRSNDDDEEEHLWLERICELTNAPVLLAGPGGMGKSTFLSHLFYIATKSSYRSLFSKIVLISLESIIASYHEALTHGDPFLEPNKSIILNYIAEISGHAGNALAWKNLLKYGSSTGDSLPVLLLLDGYNEIQTHKNLKIDAYAQIVTEINLLCNKVEFPHVNVVVTTRAESENWDEIIADLKKTDFAKAKLNGIKNAVSDTAPLNGMSGLLQRPMYYKHFRDSTQLPKNQYYALKKMYSALCTQADENTISEKDKQVRACTFEFFVPIIAQHMAKEPKFSNTHFDSCYKEMRKRSTKLLIAKKYNLGGAENATMLVEQVISEAFSFLSRQEQLLTAVSSRQTIYQFRHQDYRDFLATEFFLQRLESLSILIDEDIQGDGESFDLDLFRYNIETVRLIYQALDFEHKFVDHFSKANYQLNAKRMSAEYLQWSYVAYQLSDLIKQAKVSYEAIGKDTLNVLEPLTTYASYEYGGVTQNKVLLNLNTESKAWIIKILMKSCEMNRRDWQFEKAYEIIKIAEYVISNETNEGGMKSEMRCEIDHYFAKVRLYQFMKTNNPSGMKSSLNILYECARGKGYSRPYRFSCTIVGMLLVSPQSYLAELDDYRAFLHELPSPPATTAFWLLYSAIFYEGIQLEKSITLNYATRQLLFLLAENRVQISSDVLKELDATALEFEHAKKRLVIEESYPSPIFPTISNVVVIDKLLKSIEDINGSWKDYLLGLCEYFLSENDEAALRYFNAANQGSTNGDPRAKLWIAALEGNQRGLEEIWKERKKMALMAKSKDTESIESYNVLEWFDRDITALYEALQGRFFNEAV